MPDPAVRYERPSGRFSRFGHIVLDRPPLNVLDLDALGALGDAVNSAAADTDCEGVIVAGLGKGAAPESRAFSAGVAVEDHVPERIDDMLTRFHGALLALMNLDVPTVAAIHGHCLGGGMELAAACDFRVATADASFGQPEIKVGCYPPFAAAFYPARWGTGRTLDLLLTGRTLTGAEASEWGFVDEVTEASQLIEAARERLDTLTSHSRAVTRMTVRATRAAFRRPFLEGLQTSERIYREELTRTHDMNEGVAAFIEKRPPHWKHS